MTLGYNQQARNKIYYECTIKPKCNIRMLGKTSQYMHLHICQYMSHKLSLDYITLIKAVQSEI